MTRSLISMFSSASVLLLALGVCASAWAQEETWAQGGGGAISPKDFIPVKSSEEAYSERYTFSTDLDGGGWIGVYFTISNLGFGDGHGQAKVRIKQPGQKEYSFTEKVGEGSWTSRTDTLDLTIANVRLRAKDAKGYQLDFAYPKDGTAFSLTFTNDLPMWRPGNGRIKVKDGYFKYGMIAPRASATGTLTRGGKTMKITSSGKGFADHTATNVAPFDFAKRFGRFRMQKGDVMITWREVTLAEEYGGKSLTWMMVGYKDKIVFSDASASMKTGKHVKDAKTDYTIPYAVQVDGKSKGDSVSFVMRASKMEREDLLESYGTAAKLVAGAVSKPFRYEFPSKYAIEMNIGGTKAKLSGTAPYSFDYINP